MDLSVIIASIDARRSLDDCVRRIAAACTNVEAELIVVGTSGETALRDSASVTVVPVEESRLTPELWAEGYGKSRGRIVAFTTAHCLAGPGWAEALIAALDAGAAGAGGPFVIGRRTSPLDWAVFYLRYSAFMPAILGAGRINGEIAGDNAAYHRAALEPHAQTIAAGFWELDVHKILRAQGGWLAAVPDALMEFGPSFHFRTIAAHRFAHGRHFGAGRVRGGRPVWVQVVACPLVPFVLAGRAGFRIRRSPRDIVRYLVALPWLLALAACWAVGEAWGALRGIPGPQPLAFDNVSKC